MCTESRNRTDIEDVLFLKKEKQRKIRPCIVRWKNQPLTSIFVVLLSAKKVLKCLINAKFKRIILNIPLSTFFQFSCINCLYPRYISFNREIHKYLYSWTTCCLGDAQWDEKVIIIVVVAKTIIKMKKDDCPFSYDQRLNWGHCSEKCWHWSRVWPATRWARCRGASCSPRCQRRTRGASGQLQWGTLRTF